MNRGTVALLLLGGLAAFSAEAADETLRYADPLDGDASFTAYLVAYEHDDLTLHAIVAVPVTEMPPDGYPVVIANHGYVPDPRWYG